MKHAAKRRGVSTRAFVALLAVVLVIGCVAGGTVAWLTATTDPVTNIFTYGNIDITLTETEREYKIVPGATIAKDPKVTVEGGSEACWLFVEVTENNWIDELKYTMATGWTKLENGVFYREVSADVADQEFEVLNGNKVTVEQSLTKTTVDTKKATPPTLTFKAYAVQKDAADTAAAAWALAQ